MYESLVSWIGVYNVCNFWSTGQVQVKFTSHKPSNWITKHLLYLMHVSDYIDSEVGLDPPKPIRHVSFNGHDKLKLF